MNNLNKKMQERLEKWRKNTLPVASSEKIKVNQSVKFVGKRDYGDAESFESWNEEAKRSQNRR
jgi:hypothetical protein